MARFSNFTRIVGLAAASLWMSGLAGPVSAGTARPPNILFSFVDDMFLRETKAGMTVDKATNQPVEGLPRVAVSRRLRGGGSGVGRGPGAGAAAG